MSKLRKAVQDGATTVRAHLDALYNAISGLGAGTDYGVELDDYLDYEALRIIYRQEHYARRAVDLPVKDAWAKGYRILDPEGRDLFYTPEWSAERKRLRLRSIFPRSAMFARAFRAAYILPITVGGGAPDKPLDLKKLDRIDQFLVLSGGECRPWRRGFTTGQVNPDDDAPLDFSAPESYQIRLPGAYAAQLGAIPTAWTEALSGKTRIHASRLIRVVNGNLTLSESFQQTESEGESLISIIFRVLAQHATVDAAAATLATEMRQHVVTIENMNAIKASNQKSAFEERMGLLAKSKTVARLILLGKGEKFESATGAVGGFENLAQSTRDALCAAVSMSESKFFGRSSGGSMGGEDPHADDYVALLRSIWDELFCDPVEAVYRLVRAQRKGPWRGRGYMTAVEVVPKELRELKPKDRATLRLLNAQTDSIYSGMGAVPPNYVAERFKDPTGWRENLPEYDEKKWPPLPPEPPKGSTTPNAEGKNAPGQIPATPGESVGTSKGSTAGTSVEAANGTQTSAGDRADTKALIDATVRAILDDGRGAA